MNIPIQRRVQDIHLAKILKKNYPFNVNSAAKLLNLKPYPSKDDAKEWNYNYKFAASIFLGDALQELSVLN